MCEYKAAGECYDALSRCPGQQSITSIIGKLVCLYESQQYDIAKHTAESIILRKDISNISEKELKMVNTILLNCNDM